MIKISRVGDGGRGKWGYGERWKGEGRMEKMKEERNWSRGEDEKDGKQG